MMVSKRNLLFQGLIFRFHVKLRGVVFRVEQFLGMAPAQDSSDHQDYEPFLVGNPTINLYLPLLLGRGHTQ